ncbi:hypothetical protein G6F24_014029 [Rhizopus arrhizus]|nr:hypothetical protein G6F24_014029 [Rhizopus arrhizus]
MAGMSRDAATRAAAGVDDFNGQTSTDGKADARAAAARRRSISGSVMPALADQLLRETGPQPAAAHVSPDGAVLLLRHRFEASEGEMGHPRQLRLGMAMAGGGWLQQRTLTGVLQAPWRPGQFNLVLPGDSGTYASPAVDVLGIAIDTHAYPHDAPTLQHLQPLAARLHHDPVVASVLQALWCSAQAGACLPGFLEHGAQVLLHRLGQLAGQRREVGGTATPLRASRWASPSWLPPCRCSRPASAARCAPLPVCHRMRS